MKAKINDQMPSRKTESNNRISLNISIGSHVLKMFRESRNSHAKKIIEETAKHTTSFSKREQLEKLLQE